MSPLDEIVLHAVAMRETRMPHQCARLMNVENMTKLENVFVQRWKANMFRECVYSVRRDPMDRKWIVKLPAEFSNAMVYSLSISDTEPQHMIST